MAALNIKNDEAHRLAKGIAALTGTSVTDAVLTALREKREALAPDQARIAALLAYGARFGRRAGKHERTSAEADDLYDDPLGLPG